MQSNYDRFNKPSRIVAVYSEFGCELFPDFQSDTLNTPLDPATANRCTYAADNPTNNTDPTGQSILGDIGEIGGKIVEGALGCVSGLAATEESGAGLYAEVLGGPLGTGIVSAGGCIVGAAISLAGGGEISEY